jgi:Type I restriction modification DNA specificity domain/N-6 DNA Methylase
MLRMKDKIISFCEVLNNIGVIDSDEMMKSMLGVKKTYKYIYKNNTSVNGECDIEETFNVMKKYIEPELGYFKGDKNLFYNLFKIGQDIDVIEFINYVYKNNRNKILLTPHSLINYISNIIKDKNFKNILITDAYKSLEHLESLISENKDKMFTLTSQHFLAYQVLKLEFEDYENVNITYVSIYEDMKLKEKYDFIFAVPTFGRKFDKNEKIRTFIAREADGIATQNLLNYISDNGTLCIILPAKFTFAGDEYEKLRNYIMDNYKIESIHALPDETFKPNSSIKTYLTCISNKSLLNTYIGELRSDSGNLQVHNEKSMPYEDFLSYNSWQVDIILEENEELAKLRKLDLPKVKLKEVADVFRGKSIMKKDISPGKIYVLNISNIEDGEIIFNNMDTIDEEERKIKRYELKDGDLVLTCRGTVNKVAIYRKIDDRIVIASANIIVMRFKKQILSECVKILLESSLGKILLKSFQRGTNVMNINPSDLEEFILPIPSLKIQEEVAEEYNNEYLLYKQSIDQAKNKWISNKQKIYENLFDLK